MQKDKSISIGTGGWNFYWRIVVAPHPSECLAVFGLIFGTAVLDALSVGLSVPLLDVIMQKGVASHGRWTVWLDYGLKFFSLPNTSGAVIFSLLVIMTAIFVLRSALFVFSKYRITSIAFKLRNKIRSALLDHFLDAQFAEILRRGRGQILKDISAPAELIYINVSNLGHFVTGAITVLALTSLLIYLSWWMTAVTALVSLVIIQGWKWLTSARSTECGRQVYELERGQSKWEVDAIDGAKVVKTHLLNSFIVREYQKILGAEIPPQLKLAIYKHGPLFINELAGGIAILILGAMACFAPSFGVNFALLGAFLLAIRRISPGLVVINNSLVEIRRSWRGLEVVDDVLHEMPSEFSGSKPAPSIDRIRFDSVSFSYGSAGSGRWALSNVCWEAKRGEVTAIAGPTGAGKSTLAGLILGLYRPASGKILVGLEDLGEIDLKAWRRKIGYVSQDVFLFNTSMRDNIALWDPSVSQNEIDQVLDQAQLSEFIAQLPDGLNTIVGDRGLKLSGGQCQRLAIARTLLRKPEVLIFDEATSALDNLTEKAVYQAIHGLRSQAIVISISHRLSTIHQADRIVVLREGRVVESGSSEELMKTKGFFWELNGSQEVEKTVS